MALEYFQVPNVCERCGGFAPVVGDSICPACREELDLDAFISARHQGIDVETAVRLARARQLKTDLAKLSKKP